MDLREQDCEMRYLAATVRAAVHIPAAASAANRSTRFSKLRTGRSDQNLCPRAVGMPRAVRAAAIAWGVVMPRARISAIT
jgi:hypothetical protein